MSDNDILDQLRRDGHIRSADARATPLSGGVSSDIYLVEDGSETWVVKRALEKLKVRDDWFADISRNRFELEYLEYVGAILPQAVPRVVFAGDGYFAMEHLGEGFANWKQLMLDGRYEPACAEGAGYTLGVIHRASRGDWSARERFDSTDNFHQLRSDPYLVTTGIRHPDLTPMFEAEVNRLESTRECLVHGDYSPKNILVSESRMVILDCEVAWYGDPAFDLAFLLTHLHLKAVHRPSASTVLATMARKTVASYLAARDLEDPESTEMLQRTCRLLLMILLARIDGKSPVEYLTDPEQKQWVRRFTKRALLGGIDNLSDISSAWYAQAAKLHHTTD
ncbi:5-methylthioribose kinase (EC [Olavius algarvensis associated proteobacterium Delta 3]|nr:5-methylthioribose kinase (EC [Olavius algarvensis associated proteobacterium Delta 3]